MPNRDPPSWLRLSAKHCDFATMEMTSEVGSSHDFPAFKLLLSCPAGLNPSEVSVVFDQTYDRIPHLDTSLENSITEIWDERSQQNPSLFNGLKFRYGGQTLTGKDGSCSKANVCLHLGLTDYSGWKHDDDCAMIATNLCE